MWRLNTFGAVCFFTQNKQLGVRLSSASKALISFLSIHRGRSVPRDELAYAVWAADYDKKLQHRLSNIVWRLGNLSSNLKIAGAAGFFFVEPSGNMRLNDCSGMHIDFDMLENAVRTCQINPTLARKSKPSRPPHRFILTILCGNSIWNGWLKSAIMLGNAILMCWYF